MNSVPEIGKIYFDNLSYSDTYGEEFECIEINEKDVWHQAAYIMKHLESGMTDRYTQFDWRLKEE